MTKSYRKSEAPQAKAAGPIAFKLAVSETGEVEGYGSIFGNVDSYGDRVVRGAFAASIAKHQASGTRPLMLWQHRPDQPIGRWESFSEDSIGLRLRGRFNLETSGGRDAHAHVKAGDVGGLSIGYLPVRVKQSGDVMDLLEIDLRETSIVSFPANPLARVEAVKSLGSIADLERGLRGEIPLQLPRGAAAKLAAGGWPALVGGDEPEEDPAILELAALVKAARLDLTKGNRK